MFSGARSGCVLSRWRTRSTTTVVLPVPAPARTMSGPSPHSTAERCSVVSWIPVCPTADSLTAITITAKAKGSPCHLARHEVELLGGHAPDARLVRREPVGGRLQLASRDFMRGTHQPTAGRAPAV